MKKIIIFNISIILISVLAIIYLYYFKKQYSPIDLSTLDTIEFNGKSYKTTGAIPSDDVESHEELKRIIESGKAKENSN